MNAVPSIDVHPHLTLAPDPDRALAEQLHARSSRKALTALHTRSAAKIRDAATPIAGRANADDVVQDVILVIMQRPQNVPLDALGDYVVRLARSLARERASGRAHDVPLDDVDRMARRGIPRSARKRGAE